MPNSDPPVGDDVERGERLGRARRVVVVGDHLADAVAEADALGARGGGGEEHFGRRGVRVFLEEVVLDLPGVVEAEPVGEHDLVQRVVEQRVLVALAPGLGQLQLVEDPEPHFIPFASIVIRRWARCRGGAGLARLAAPRCRACSSAFSITPGRSKNGTGRI